MRLLFLNHNYRNVGTYYRAMPMAERLARRGHEVTLLTVSPIHRWRAVWSEVNGVRLGELPNLAQNNSGEGYGPLDNLSRLWHACRHAYDIVHMFDHKPNASFAGLPARWRGAKLIADWADWWGGPGGINDVPKRRFPVVGKFEAWWEVEQKRWADGVVTISTVLQQRALEIGCPAERVVYIPTGAATDRIAPTPVEVARRQVNAPPARAILGFIGFGQGDLAIVMEALRQLPDVWLMVIGPEYPHIRALAEQYGVAERLWQTGRKLGAEVSPYLACADVMVMPMMDTAANRGRLPNKMLDYLAAGRPIVASPVGDVKTIVEQFGVGLLAANEEFANAIERLLKDERLRSDMGSAARRAAETAFDWEHLIDRLEAFYQRVIG
jgi:glycosyltransferase involved in cell wall biosynthesis